MPCWRSHSRLAAWEGALLGAVLGAVLLAVLLLPPLLLLWWEWQQHAITPSHPSSAAARHSRASSRLHASQLLQVLLLLLRCSSRAQKWC